jgi:hypothetical protein
MDYKEYEQDYTSTIQVPARPNKPILKGSTPQDHREYADALETYNFLFKAYEVAMAERKTDQRRLDEEYKQACFRQLGIAGHPKREILWDKAYSLSRDEGMYQVYMTMYELIALIQ